MTLNMWSKHSSQLNSIIAHYPAWFHQLFGSELNVDDMDHIILNGTKFVCRNGILRAKSLISDAQKQTSDSFGFKWQKRETFESKNSLSRMKKWLLERYGDLEKVDWWSDYEEKPLVIDAGCGAGMSAIELFGPILNKVRFIGTDISEAVDVAAARFAEKSIEAAFLQVDILDLPFNKNSIDVIFSEGVMHHTDSTEGALKALTRLLRPGGRFLFYVYNKKGPVREFTDDYIRNKIQILQPNDAWQEMMPLTKLGNILGELNIEIEIPEKIKLLDIPAGKINIQRLFYWHFLKAFYHPDLTLDEMNHINYDWYAPANAHRQTPDEVRKWCEEANLDIKREVVEPAGITIIAQKKSQSI